MKIIVIGGGPAGMMAAGVAAGRGHNVTLLEKNKRLGQKLYITGSGRCNITNASDPQELIENVVSNPSFLYSGFYTFGSSQVMDFFENLGVPVKVERGRRVFPSSDKSSDVVKAMERFIKEKGVEVLCNSTVSDVLIKDGSAIGVRAGKEILADAVIVATGGLSYPATGSTGDGYRFARECGHSVTKLYPSLVPLCVREPWVSELQGLSLKNVNLSLTLDKKTLYSGFGEMLFTHYGISGPLVLSASCFIAQGDIQRAEILIDLKPNLQDNVLDSRILRDFAEYANKDLKNALDDLLPQKLIPVIISLSGISPEKKGPYQTELAPLF